MTRPLVIVRPEPGWSATADAARALGFEIAGKPLFRIEPVEWEAPNSSYDALLVGSANVFRHGGPSLDELRHLPIHCVGKTTAEEARAIGFEIASVGAGGLQNVLDAIGSGVKLLRLAGEERISLDIPKGTSLDERIVYRTIPESLSEEDLPTGSVIVLHSAAAARQLGEEVARLGLDRLDFTLAALGPRIADAAGEGWHSVHTSDTPEDAALLALAKPLCQ